MRRGTNFGIDISLEEGPGIALVFVYVPDGIPVANLNINMTQGADPGSMYSLEQHVIMSGIASTPYQARSMSRFGRNLGSNDQIVLLIHPIGTEEEPALVLATVRFVVAFV
jgi:hypothetical protein